MERQIVPRPTQRTGLKITALQTAHATEVNLDSIALKSIW